MIDILSTIREMIRSALIRLLAKGLWYSLYTDTDLEGKQKLLSNDIVRHNEEMYKIAVCRKTERSI